VVGRGDDRVARFLLSAEQAKMMPHRVPDATAAVKRILELCQEMKARSALVPAEDWPGREEVLTALQDEGVSLADPDDRDAAFGADVGITGVAVAVAETGSLCLDSGGVRRRLASLAVPVHIAVVRADQIVPDLLDWTAAAPADMPASSVLVSAPSKTADIELTLVMGVHGPRVEHVVVIG
jgi:L-lactate dehydrogenase complex protein LldG